jgi:hypothetical protein
MAYKRRPTLLTLVTSYEDCPVEIDRKEYTSIVEGFMKFISNKLLNGDSVTLPASMGSLSIIGRKQKISNVDGKIKGLAPNWKETLKLWKENSEAKLKKTIIYHFNEHSRGIRYKFGWLTANVPIRNKGLFAFIATRDNKRAVWKNILEGKEYQIVKPLSKN